MIDVLLIIIVLIWFDDDIEGGCKILYLCDWYEEEYLKLFERFRVGG